MKVAFYVLRSSSLEVKRILNHYKKFTLECSNEAIDKRYF